jgi:hypothetical protein
LAGCHQVTSEGEPPDEDGVDRHSLYPSLAEPEISAGPVEEDGHQGDGARGRREVGEGGLRDLEHEQGLDGVAKNVNEAKKMCALP